MNIRIVNSRGRHTLYYCETDEDGNVELLYDEISLPCNDYHAMAEMIDAIAEAKKHPVVMLNSANRIMLFRED